MLKLKWCRIEKHWLKHFLLQGVNAQASFYVATCLSPSSVHTVEPQNATGPFRYSNISCYYKFCYKMWTVTLYKLHSKLLYNYIWSQSAFPNLQHFDGLPLK